jgi:regulatory protein
MSQTVTAIEPQKRNKDRVNVFLDGEFAFGIDVLAASGLRVGQTLERDAIVALQDEDAFDRARQSAFRYLAYRPRSIAEVQRNLRRKQFDEVQVEQVLSYLVQKEYLDDRAFAAYWVEQRDTFKPRGSFALRQELREKGVAREIIDAVVEDVDERDAALRAARKRVKRWSHLPFEEFRRKLGGYLQRRGFGYDTINRTIDTLWNQLEN